MKYIVTGNDIKEERSFVTFGEAVDYAKKVTGSKPVDFETDQNPHQPGLRFFPCYPPDKMGADFVIIEEIYEP